MTKDFYILGSIVDADADKSTAEDVTPTQIQYALKELKDGDTFALHISSCGGSVFAGLAILNLLKQARECGIKTTARVIGLAASMASCIACGCDELAMDSESLLMIHLPYTLVQGNSNELRKEAETLDTLTDTLVAVYRTKFDRTDEEIKAMLADETWIPARQASMFGLRCEIVQAEGGENRLMRIAAKLTGKGFRHIPEGLIMDEKTQDENAVAEATEQTQIQEAVAVEQQPESDTDEETIPKAEAEKRVIGMQSAMGKQIEALKKQHAAEIENLNIELKTQTEELAKAKAEAISLATRLADAQRELQETASALEAKTQALCTLNANVLTPSEDLPTLAAGLAKCKTPQEKVDFIRGGNYIH